jgi:hypothetical protein
VCGEELIEIQDFAVKARYFPEATPLPAIAAAGAGSGV